MLFRRFGCVCILFVSCLSQVLAQSSAKTPAWAVNYETVRPSEDVYIVGKNGKMGIVTATGFPLTKLAYDSIYNFHEGVAVVGRGKREINRFGKVLADFKYGYLSKTGRLIVPMKYAHINSFSEGLGLVEHGNVYHDYHYSYFDKKGKLILDLQHVNPSMPFSGNTAYAHVWENGFWLPMYNDGRNNGDHKQLYDINGETIYGNYLDRQGRRLIPWKYDTIAPYFPGYIRAVRKNGKWGFLDSTANVAIALQYDDIDADSAFFWRKLRRVGIAGRYGFMDDHTGKLVFPLQFQDSKPSRSAFVWVRQNKHWGCLNEAGKIVIPFHFDDAFPVEAGTAIVQLNGKWGLVDTMGRVLAKAQYDNILPFQESRAVFKRDGKLGFLNPAGREVIPPDYTKVSQFKNGQAFASRWGLFITLDANGNWIETKLQPDTLKLILGVLITVGIAIGTYLKYRQNQLRQAV